MVVAEDEPLVRAIACRILMHAGYECWEAKDGREALRLILQAERPVDLLLTDVVMPLMSGAELCAELTRHRPDLPILCTSGYAPADLLARGFDVVRHRFVPKPFHGTDLVEAVRATLAGDSFRTPVFGSPIGQ